MHAGRLGHILGSNTPALGLILGPPEAWQKSAGSSLTMQHSGLHRAASEHKSNVRGHGAALLEDLRLKLRYNKC